MPRARLLLPAVLLLVLASAPRARADVLELRDGRLVEGVVSRTGDTYVVYSRFGATEVPVADVVSRSESKPVDLQVAEHLAKLDPDDMASRARLAKWLLDIGREEEAREMAGEVLETDPECALAHEVLGHVRHGGVWMTPDEAKRADGLERHGDAWYTPEEWARTTGAAREKALEAERDAAKRQIAEDVNRAVRLMLSPDPKVRARGREHLVALAKEYENPSLAKLAHDVDAYVEKLDEMRKAEAAALAGGGGGDRGVVLGEIRATFAKLKRPIKVFETSLASNIGGAPVRIQLPELEVIRVRTVAAIPAVIDD